MLNIPYSTEHFSTNSLRTIPELLRKSELRALGFRSKDGFNMVYRSNKHPNLRFVRFCDDIESTKEASAEDDMYCLVEEDEDLIVDEEL